MPLWATHRQAMRAAPPKPRKDSAAGAMPPGRRGKTLRQSDIERPARCRVAGRTGLLGGGFHSVEASVSLLRHSAAIDVVSRIYSAALDESQWQRTVVALTAWIGGEVGCVQVRCLGPQPRVRLVHCGIDSSVEQAYQQYYQHIDPHLTRVAQLPRGRTVLSREVVGDEEFFSSEFYNDFFRPQGICDLQGAMLIRNASHVVTFATQSSLRQRYDDQTRARMDALVPHLTRALEFVVRADCIASEQSALLAASQARHRGLLRVNAELAVLEASEQTLAWLSQHCGALVARDGRLLASDAQDAERLQLCVRSALAQATARCELNGSAGESVVLSLFHRTTTRCTSIALSTHASIVMALDASVGA